MPRGGRRVGAGRKKGGMNRTLSNKEMQTFWRVANKLAGGTDNDLLRVAALLIGIAPLAEAAKSAGTDLPDLLKRCELAGRAIKEHPIESAAWVGAYCL
jgi:hypothetical protein